jgi:hypothetical protein
MSKRLCQNNKEALRWCMSRRATVQFANWKSIRGKRNLPEGITCSVSLGRLVKIDKSLIKTVNLWIKQFNKEQEADMKTEKK